MSSDAPDLLGMKEITDEILANHRAAQESRAQNVMEGLIQAALSTAAEPRLPYSVRSEAAQAAANFLRHEDTQGIAERALYADWERQRAAIRAESTATTVGASAAFLAQIPQGAVRVVGEHTCTRDRTGGLATSMPLGDAPVEVMVLDQFPAGAVYVHYWRHCQGVTAKVGLYAMKVPDAVKMVRTLKNSFSDAVVVVKEELVSTDIVYVGAYVPVSNLE